MSYILDALKKAERERNLDEIPTLDTVHEAGPASGGRAWSIAAVVFATSAIVLAVWLWQPKPQPQPVASLQPTAPPPAQQAGEALIPKAAPEAVVPPPGHKTLSRVAPERMDARPEPDSTQDIPPAHDVPSLPARSAVKAPQEPFSATASSPSAPARPPLRDAAGNMKMTIHMYAEAKAERMVFINGTKYAEGDYVEGSYLLESITAEGAVLSHEGERIVISPPSR